MVPSADCESFIKGFEKFRSHAYKPTPTDRWTCGWGSTGPDIGPDTVFTQAQGDTRFDQDMARFGGGVWLLLHGPTTQHQFDALTSLAYNIGLSNYHNSTVLARHNLGDYIGAAAHFIDWNKQHDAHGVLVVLDGLTTRRAAEAKMYLSA